MMPLNDFQNKIKRSSVFEINFKREKRKIQTQKMIHFKWWRAMFGSEDNSSIYLEEIWSEVILWKAKHSISLLRKCNDMSLLMGLHLDCIEID